MDVLIVIPARGGSTRIPRKNVKEFNGAPMINWPISAAIASGFQPKVVVSTDDREIAEISTAAGASVPFIRPAELADDHAGTAPVIVHTINSLETEDDVVVMCLYPTSPLPAAMVAEGLAVASANPHEFVITVGRHRSPHERSVVSASNGMMSVSDPTALLVRTQDLPRRYFDAGRFYVATASEWRSRTTMMEKPFVPFFLPDWATIDMDEPEDWPVAEALHRAFVLDPA